MTIPAATAATLDLLDQLMVADDVWAYSAEEGRAVANHILDSQAAIVLLYGPARAASTAFMQRWVIPLLSQRTRVSYVASGEPISFEDAPDAATSIRIFDGFEHHLAEGATPTDALRRLAAASATSRTGKLVLVVQEDYLNRLFMARDVIPTILDDVFAIPAMPVEKFVASLERTAAALGVALDAGFLAALSRDLDAVRTRATPVPELVAILAFELHRTSSGGSRRLTREDYEARDELPGMLAAHLDYLFESLPAGISADIGWAVLHEVVRTAVGTPTDLVDVANRFDVGVDVPTAVASWLETERRILRHNGEGGHDLVPALLARGVEYHARRMSEATEHTHAQLRQASRQYLEYHALPPEPTFRRINAHRSALVVADDEARLMLRCALAYNGDSSEALHHWLRRVTSETAAIEILLDALFDSRPDVRARAARCLGRFDNQDVRDQLHLIALRDTVAAVRAAAVDSLEKIATPALRSALTRETLDPNSPYRLQAIEALRIFRDDRTVSTLGAIVDGSGAGHEDRARLLAIDVLGRHDTPQAVGALARIAVHDPDAEDWQAAATALGNIGSDESAAVALDAIDAERRAVPGNSRAALPPSFTADGVAFALAAALIVGTYFVNGLILFVLGRRRAGIVLTVLGAIGWTAVFAEVELPAALLLLTVPLGFLMPLRTLLIERFDGVPPTRLRRALGILLFGGACVTAFALVHGLSSALVRRIKRGLVITAFQVAAVFLIFSSSFLAQDVFAQYDGAPLFRWASFAVTALIVVGGALFVGTYIAGVGTTFLDLFAWRGRREVAARVDRLYTHLLANQHGSRALLDEIASTATCHAGGAVALARRYRRLIFDALVGLWADAAPAVQSRILKVMARRPDAQSVEFLRRVSKPLGFRARLRAALALWTYRISIWPKSLLLFGTLAVFVLAMYTAALWDLTNRNPWGLMRTVEAADEDSPDALRQLTTLAGAEDPKLAAPAITSLQLVLRGEVRKLQGLASGASNPELQRAVLDNLPPGGLPRIEDTIADLLRDSRDDVTRLKAVRALHRLGSRAAVERLRRFAESAPEVPQSLSTGSGDRAFPLKVAALDALKDMTGTGIAPLTALLSMQDSQQISEDLRFEAARAARAVDPVVWAEYQLERSDYGSAYDWLSRAQQQSGGDDAYRQRVQNALARVHLRRGLVALATAERDPMSPAREAATSDLLAAVSASEDPAHVRDAADYGLRLGYLLHETVALRDPEAFEDSYHVFVAVAPVAWAISREQGLRVDANKAEAALTIGRFNEAQEIARDVIRELERQPIDALQGTALNMKLVRYAALLLRNNPEAAPVAAQMFEEYDTLARNGFTNTWEYAGTERYLASSNIPAASRRAIRDAINRIKPNR